MKRMKDRTNRILEILTKETRTDVVTLSELLGVSQVTVRKDLDALEKKKIIRREHGVARLCSPDDINRRLAYHYSEKLRIAKKAAELVHDGDTIMIESGSCCAILADVLTSMYRTLTIITNSAFIADYIRGKSGFQTVVLGGMYQNDAQVMVGPMVRECVTGLFVDLFFVGTDGYFSGQGFTNCDQMRSQAVRDMAGSAKRVIVLTESEKFHQRGVVPLGITERLFAVITDEGIPAEIAGELEEKGIQTIIAG